MTLHTVELTAVQQQLDNYRGAIDTALQQIVAELRGDDAVTRALRYAVGGGGKRLRPALCLAAIDALHGPAEHAGAVRAAAAIELVHTYSLVHDDLPCMDDDDLRRGRPTTHRLHGTSAAMLAGCALIPLACHIVRDGCLLLGLSEHAVAAAVRELCTGAGATGMVGGQVLDLEGEGAQLSLALLRKVHARKTGALFAAALRLGAVLGRGTAAQRAALDSYGERLGLAFQIRDDVLDVTTDARSLGKTPGKDIDAAKATFPALLGTAAAAEAAVAEATAAAHILRAAGIASPLLDGLARFAAVRER